MEKPDLTKQFACRLRQALLQAGFSSLRSTSGVSIHKLAEMTGHSLQICRKYVRGEAMPEPLKLIELAQKLKVSPGWLLFGENEEDHPNQKETISISRNLLHYILAQIQTLDLLSSRSNEITNFAVDLIYDLSLINTDEEQSKKIVDLALASIKHFRN